MIRIASVGAALAIALCLPAFGAAAGSVKPAVPSSTTVRMVPAPRGALGLVFAFQQPARSTALWQLSVLGAPGASGAQHSQWSADADSQPIDAPSGTTIDNMTYTPEMAGMARGLGAPLRQDPAIGASRNSGFTAPAPRGPLAFLGGTTVNGLTSALTESSDWVMFLIGFVVIGAALRGFVLTNRRLARLRDEEPENG